MREYFCAHGGRGTREREGMFKFGGVKYLLLAIGLGDEHMRMETGRGYMSSSGVGCDGCHTLLKRRTVRQDRKDDDGKSDTVERGGKSDSRRRCEENSAEITRCLIHLAVNGRVTPCVEYERILRCRDRVDAHRKLVARRRHHHHARQMMNPFAEFIPYDDGSVFPRCLRVDDIARHEVGRVCHKTGNDKEPDHPGKYRTHMNSV